MKVAFIIPRLVNKGPVIVIRDLVKLLSDQIEVIHVYHFGSENEIIFDCPTFKISLFDKIDFDFYNIVHSNMFKPDLYVFIHRKRQNTNTKFISTLHQNIYDNLSNDFNFIFAYFLEIIWLFLFKKFDKIVTLTDTLKIHYFNKNTHLNFHTIYNGRKIVDYNTSIPLIELESLMETKSKYTILGVHCLLTKRKGIDQIIKALPLLQDYFLIILGDGKEFENLKLLSKNLNVSNRCIFLGFKENVIDYLNLIDIYVMSSFSEGFPLALLEAGGIGKPIVCSDIEIFRELFNDNEVCFFELNNTISLTNAILKVNSQIDSFSKNIKTTINSKYSDITMANNYFDLYKNLINL
jgi:glycosyltransferase involved in cell wall biosynthesis